MFRLKLFIVLLIAAHFLILSTASANAPTESPRPATPLNEPRVATELPLKRKVPTSQPVDLKRQATDRQIKERLTRIARSQPPFNKIKIEVSEGIVTLKGEVEEEAYAKSFSALSEKVEDVIGVIDQMQVTSIKKTGLRLAQHEITGLLQRFFKFLPYLVSCAVILLLTMLLGYGIYRLWRYILLGPHSRLSRRPMLAQQLARLFTVPVYLLGFYLILQVGGAAGLAATLVGGTGVIGIVVGLAGKNILENLLSSFMLTLRNPFKVGDEVQIGDSTGVVHRVDSRCTMLLDYNGVFTQIPNSTVLSAVIRNITAHPVNKVSFSFQLGAGEDLAAVTKLFHEAVEMNASVIQKEPKPALLVTDVTASGATVRGEFWMSVHERNADQVRSNMLQSFLYLRSKQQKTSMPPTPAAAYKNAVEKLIEDTKTRPSGRAVLNKQAKNIREPDL